MHYAEDHDLGMAENGVGKVGGGRWLVIDETGGLVVAAMAERMGILQPPPEGFDCSDGGNSEMSSSEPQMSTTSVSAPIPEGSEPADSPNGASSSTDKKHPVFISAPTNSL